MATLKVDSAKCWLFLGMGGLHKHISSVILTPPDATTL